MCRRKREEGAADMRAGISSPRDATSRVPATDRQTDRRRVKEEGIVLRRIYIPTSSLSLSLLPACHVLVTGVAVLPLVVAGSRRRGTEQPSPAAAAGAAASPSLVLLASTDRQHGNRGWDAAFPSPNRLHVVFLVSLSLSPSCLTSASGLV